MTDPLAGKLVIGISSRALFDLDAANDVFEREGLAAYRDFQRERERQVLNPGTGFGLVKGLLSINARTPGLVEVVVFSKNSADSAMRVFYSIEHHGLAISRGVFRAGRDPWPFLPAFHCDLFLTAEPEQVLKARNQGVAAALVMRPPNRVDSQDDSEVRIAFDGDAVLFGDESERVFARDGIDAFRAHEAAKAEIPMPPGPFRPFLEGLARIQRIFPIGESPVRTALVTARDAPAHLRVIHTLRAWDIEVDETYFLGGVEKTEVLAAFGAHIFFDDQLKHVERAAAKIPSAQVLWPPEDIEAAPVSKQPLARLRQPDSGRPRKRARDQTKSGGTDRARPDAAPATTTDAGRGVRRVVAPRSSAR